MNSDLAVLGQLRQLELLQTALSRLTEPENRSATWLGAMSRDQLLAWLLEHPVLSHCSYCGFTVRYSAEGVTCKSGRACPYHGATVEYVYQPGK